MDSSGNGLADAMIIFNVPEIVPAVYSDFSGYYEIFAPAGTYQVNVWPPFDTNYLSFAQRGFTVGTSIITKNMTLNTGYKLSGYITDQFGAPVRGALVSLDQFHCGWYSKSSGYYFVTAPVGIYNLLIQPKKGPTFPNYKEENFVINGDETKSFTVNVQTEQVTPPNDSTAPAPIQSEPILGDISDDFSTDSGFWQYLGSAYRDQTNQYLVLTTSANDQTGVTFFRTQIQDAFTASFNYKGSGDGFLLFFYKQEYPSPIAWEESYGDNGVAGGRLGFNTQSIIPGYGVEFDGWRNIASEFDDIIGGTPNPSADPSDSHIALIKDFTGNHVAYVNDQRIYDNEWHQVVIEVQASSVAVYFDQELVLQWNGVLDRTYGGLGFSGSNGMVEASWHIIDNFSITAHNVQRPSLSVSCRSSTSYSGFSVLIDGYLTIDEKGVSDAPIMLSYSVNGGKTWEDLTLTYTDSEGHYSATWLPSVTGNYLIKANYEGDADTLGTSSE
ncbi:MAG: hypothetical protein NWF03_05150, partial [Candidatus Bathyarchaeota archaeon]|nr:hypothetical protein [Candidatus Bathyarchaeota archaeon]